MTIVETGKTARRKVAFATLWIEAKVGLARINLANFKEKVAAVLVENWYIVVARAIINNGEQASSTFVNKPCNF